MNMEIYYSYYAAKAARERKDNPTHWIITQPVLGVYKLICAGNQSGSETTEERNA